MLLQGIVNRIWQDPSDKVVSLMFQGEKEVHRINVHKVDEETVGLTKPTDVLQLVMEHGPVHPTVTQWNNRTLDADRGY